MVRLLLSKRDLRDAAAILTRAYADDPAFPYLFPEPRRRPTQMRWLYDRLVWVMARHGQIVRSTRGRGLAVWIPPDRSPNVPARLKVASGLVAAPLRFGPTIAGRLALIDRDNERRHREHVDEPHWVLEALAVEPEARGAGVGSELLESGLEHADMDGLPTYLLTHNPRNVTYYERYNFEMVEAAAVPGTPLTCWSMRRRPRDEGRVAPPTEVGGP